MGPLTTAEASAVVRRHLDPDASCDRVERGPIGNGQETWFLDVTRPAGPHPLVLRRTAAAGPLEWTDRGVETCAMRDAVGVGLPVPVVHHVDTEGGALGAPWMLMDRADGAPATHARGDERAALAVDLARRLGALHAAAIPDPTGRDATTATRDEVHRWREHDRRHRGSPLPLLDGLLAWLAATVPDLGDAPAVLLWGDAGAHNTLGSDGRVTAMLDWELAHHGHPLEDLAAAVWMEEEAGVDVDPLVAAYEEATGAPVDRALLDWFVALTCVTRSLMILTGSAAVTAGRSHAPHLAGLGLHLPARQLVRAARLAGWPVPDDADRPASAGGRTPVAGDVLRPRADELADAVARFLDAEVLDVVDDPRTRRGLKTAVALLETAALRVRHEPAVTATRREATAELLAGCAAVGLDGDLATIAAAVETDDRWAGLRPRVRAHLVDDLLRQRALLAPLAALYER